jgi:hypothetical protein
VGWGFWAGLPSFASRRAAEHVIDTKNKSLEKSIPAGEKEKNLRIKSLQILPNAFDLQKENHTLGHGFKNLANGFLFFVIPFLVLKKSPIFCLFGAIFTHMKFSIIDF